ncbi:MAG: type secretion system protein TssA [Pseudomonadota bacterium]|jgi:type VI secretion system protein ImpA
MQNLQLEALLAPVVGDKPSGRDLESTLELYALENAAKEPEEAGIKGVETADTRNWSAIAKQATSLLGQSKDLRAAVLLARALLHTKGVAGYCEAIGFIRALLERYWADAYPSLEEDGQDADMRLNAVRELWNARMLSQLRSTTLLTSRELGAITVNDVLAATSAPGARATTTAPPLQHVTRALSTQAPAELVALSSAIHQAGDDLRWVASFVAEKVGGHFPLNPTPLAAPLGERPTGILDGLGKVLSEYAVIPAAAAATESTTGELTPPKHEVTDEVQTMTVVSLATTRTSPAMQLVGEAQTRDDALQLLEQVCKYYARHEPSSPVPLLLERAKRIATMSFLDLVRDLADKGLPQVEALVGKETKA